MNPANTPYRTLRDFACVGLIAVVPNLLVVRRDLDVKDAKDFFDQARADPTKLKYASAALGSSPHFAFELLKMETKADVLHVPYNGSAPAMNALAGGFVDAYIGSVFSVKPLIDSGKAKVLAAVSRRRLPDQPDVETLAEQGLPDIEWDTWYGIMVPSKVPSPLLEKLNKDMNQAFNKSEVKERISAAGMNVKLGSINDMQTLLEGQISNVKRVAEFAKLIQN